MDLSEGNSALGLKLGQFLGAAGSIIQGNIGKTAGTDALSQVESVSCVACQASTLVVLGLA